MAETPQQVMPVRAKNLSPAKPVLQSWYALRGWYRKARISPSLTGLLGPQYRRSRERIEIDITYVCNLRCTNCNRSISQAPEKLHMPIEMVTRFVDESIQRKKRWKTIRVLGGEPTLHPQFLQILDELLRYRKWNPATVVEVVSNGYGQAVKRLLERIPPGIRLENTAKQGNLQPAFGPFNEAPVDDPAFRSADYRNGCSIMDECGMGLTPLGYYPCAVAGGIDRIAAKKLGYASLPDDNDDMIEVADELCRLCGHFKDGHCVAPTLRPPLLEQVMSITWVDMYRDHRQSRRAARASHSAASAAEIKDAA